MILDHQNSMTGFLCLFNKGLGDEGLEDVCKKDCSRVVLLSLSRNRISEKGMRHFPEATWSSLTNIDIQDNRLNDIACKYLTRAHIPNLQQLGLCANAIGRVAVAHLSKANWKALDRLYLHDSDSYVVNTSAERGQQLHLESIGELVGTNWMRLQVIKISQNRIRAEEMVKLVLSEHKNITILASSSDLIGRREKESLEPLFVKKFGQGKIQMNVKEEERPRRRFFQGLGRQALALQA